MLLHEVLESMHNASPYIAEDYVCKWVAWSGAVMRLYDICLVSHPEVRLKVHRSNTSLFQFWQSCFSKGSGFLHDLPELVQRILRHLQGVHESG
jgi:hypothetical protein